MSGIDRVVFSSECVTIGAFRCAVNHPSFRNSGPIRDDCFVFPRTAVVIEHEHARPFVADPTIVTLYNRRQQYERRPVSADGDRCDWFAVSPDLLHGALLDRDPAAAAANGQSALRTRVPMRRPISLSGDCSWMRRIARTLISSTSRSGSWGCSIASSASRMATSVRRLPQGSPRRRRNWPIASSAGWHRVSRSA